LCGYLIIGNEGSFDLLKFGEKVFDEFWNMLKLLTSDNSI
jgi:hypothetical protein